MDKRLLLDTDVMVDFLRGNGKAVALVKDNAGSILLSTIVVAELYAGVRDGPELSALDDFIAFCRIVSVTPEIARAGGLLKRDYYKSHGTGLGDAIIAATAQIERADLKTLNVKHFPMFKGLKPAYVRK